MKRPSPAKKAEQQDAVMPCCTSDEGRPLGIALFGLRRATTVNQDDPRPGVKPFEISKQIIWKAWKRVAANKGAPGVDRESIRGEWHQGQDRLVTVFKPFSRHIIWPMPKKIPEQELEAIAALVAAHPDGVRVGPIRDGLGFSLPPRMLQRRLNLLVEQSRIVARGTGKGTRYFPLAPPPEKEIVTSDSRTESDRIKLSRESEGIRKSVRRPLSARVPVGYQADFIDDYQPNETAYLSPELRQQLADMGQAGQAELPAGTYVRQVYNRLLIDLSWNSSRLEGNTYSLLETQLLLELGENAGGKGAEETQMILNHKAAIEMLVDQAEDRARFIEVVETELSSMHEGNIARYRLKPSQFEAWDKRWK